MEKQTILIADDNPENLDILVNILSTDYRLKVAKDGKKALKIAEDELPDLILLDIMMPEMDGFEVCRRLKQNSSTSAAPVIFITARNQFADEEKGFELGAVDYVNKPFSPIIVKSRIKTHLAVYSQNRLLAQKVAEKTADLNKALENLEIEKLEVLKASQAKSDFLSNMSHELRTPLTPIMGYSQLLMEMDFDNKVKEMLRGIYESSNSLLQMITQILDYSSMDSGSATFTKEKFSPSFLLMEIESEYRKLIEEKGLEFKVSIPDSFLEPISADKSRIETVIKHLLANALKFTDQGSITLSGKKVFDKKTNRHAFEFVLEDTGIGITPEQMQSIFLPFQQGEHFLTKKYGGTGIGLAIVKKIIELMAGEIKVESVLGKGTQIYFKIPFDHH